MAATTDLTYTAGDTDGSAAGTDEVTLMLSITIEANTAPTFSVTTLPNQSYLEGSAITTLTLPLATGGNGPVTYSLADEAALPAGLTFDGTANPPTITGTPTTPADATTVVYTAHDGDGDMTAGDAVTLTFAITIIADTAPAFAVTSIPARTFFLNEVVALTLPAATSGNGAITYTLTGPAGAALSQAVPGLTFTASTRVLSGAPTTVAATTDLTYTAGDTDGSAAGTDEVTLMLSITIEENTAPTFSVTSICPTRVTSRAARLSR